MSQFIRIVVACLCGFLSACQTLPKGDPTTDSVGVWLTSPSVFIERQQWNADNSDWVLAAKIGINTPSIKESASLVWQASAKQSTVRLFGPLGIGSVRLEFNANGAVLMDTKGRTYNDDAAEYLLMNVTGWPIPVESLKYWMFALPTPDFTFKYRLNEERLVAEIEQSGWRLAYSKYTKFAADAPKFARKIVAEREMLVGGVRQTVKVRLIIKSLSSK